MTISQEDAKCYMRCFFDMGRRMGIVGAALGCPEDADPEDILEEAKAHASFVRRILEYVRDPNKTDLVHTVVARWVEEHQADPSGGVTR